MMILGRYTFHYGRNVFSGSRKHCGLSLERRVERTSAHTYIYGYMTAFHSIQTTRGNSDSWWSLNNIAGSVTNPMQLAKSRYNIVWVLKYMHETRIIRR